MNCRLVLVVVLVLDSRACLRGRAGGPSGSWSQCMRKKPERGLSMNLGAPASLPASCPFAPRRRGRRRSQRRLGSRSQCMRQCERKLSMNRRLVLVVVLVLDSRACLRGRGRAGGRSGSWSRCMRKKAESGLSMNRTYSVYALPAKAAEGRRTPRRWRVGQGHPKLRQVLLCAAPAALWISQAGSRCQCRRERERGTHLSSQQSRFRRHHVVDKWRAEPDPTSCKIHGLRSALNLIL